MSVEQQDLQRAFTRIAQRAANAVAGPVADLSVQLAIAQETVDGQSAALAEKDRQLADKDAELARANQSADALRARIAELQAEAPAT